MNGLWVALIAMFTASMSSPLLLAWYQKRNTEKVTNAYANVSSRLDAIHMLVNSNLTAAQERELSMARALVVSMNEVISLKEDRGIPVSKATREVMEELGARIEVMANELVHKKQQTLLADAELKREKTT